MRRWPLTLFILVSSALAQFTTVTGTVVDPNGLHYAYGTINPILVNNSGQSPTLNGLPYTPPQQPAGLDANGSFTMQLADTTVLQPSGLLWNFQVCSGIGTVPPSFGLGSQCFTLGTPISISGASQSISTQLNAAALTLTYFAPAFAPPPGAPFGALCYFSATRVPIFCDPNALTDGAGTITTKGFRLSGSGPGFIDFGCGSPGNPASGFERIFCSSPTSPFNCVTSTGASCGFGSTTWDQIGAGSNLNTQTMGTGGSFSPLNLGQVAGSQMWLSDGLIAATITTTNSGGSFANNHQYLWQYTLQSALGSSLPSVQISGVLPAPCASTSCTATMVAPTIPSGYTGYSVYLCDISSGPCSAPQKVAACTNITTNCVLTAPQTSNTSSVPTINAAIIQPPNVQPTNAIAGVVPSVFFQKPDGGNYPWIGVDVSSNNGSTGGLGTPVFSHRTYFNDCIEGFAGTPGQTYRNAFVSINHCLGVGTVATNQDRGLAVQTSATAGDAITRYGIEAIQAEADLIGPGVNGTPDGEVTAVSAQTSDSHLGTVTLDGYAINGVSARVDRQTNGTTGSCRPCYNGVSSYVYDDSNSSTNSSFAYSAFTGAVFSNVGNPSDVGSVMYMFAPSTKGNRYSVNYGLFIEDFGTNTSDWNIFSSGTNGTPTSGRNWFGGNVYLPNILTAANTINVTGAIADTGSLSAAQLPTPSSGFALNVTGGTGTNYTYGLVGRDANGGSTPLSTTANASAAATLNGSNYVTICLGGPQTNLTNGYSAVDVYRTASGGTPSSTGKIGTITPANTQSSATGACLSDVGLSGDSSTAPTVNTTGGVKVAAAVTPGSMTVGSLPSASTAAGQMFVVTDSTAIASEGQTCTGSSTNKALAFSNGLIWKCF